MESGLEGRNNSATSSSTRSPASHRLNGVRPRRPEQFQRHRRQARTRLGVSMESGLEGRNNSTKPAAPPGAARKVSMESGLEGRNNSLYLALRERGVPVSMESGLEGRNNWPTRQLVRRLLQDVSMESGLEGRNNCAAPRP